ncbi:response regulator transcription factor [Flavobacterium sp. IMCC34518]|uniref:response regulator transcription factor n=1 Tax=Flavobacterium sp. IMCC34518 TaxID=3003623 RepID=UPI0022ABCDE5|nr:response regulator transcription factor [Flavobacterium sp. IMCC34518]
MSKPLILVVEDEFLIANDIKNILTDNGYEVIANVSNVAKAKEIINLNKPQLILLDINLIGEEDGIDLGNYLLHLDTIPFLYLTSFADTVTLDRAKKTRPYGFLVKPFKSIDLLTTVSIVLNNYIHKKIDIVRSDEVITDDSPLRIKQVVSYINEHINDKIEIDDLAAITRWKNHHFIRMFSKYIGMTPYQYILKIKIERAKSLLIETTEPIANIATDLGFSGYSNFCVAFKKLNNNEPPDSFRKRNTAFNSSLI